MWRRKRDEAFEAFFRTLYPRAFSTAHRILGDRAAAEDAAAEAFARAFADWRNVGALYYRDAWVLRVTANVALDQIRRRAPEQTPAGSPDVEGVATDRVALATALRALPRRQREIVALRHLAGFSEAEIAGALGLAPGTVKTHGHRAMASLRARLGETVLEGRAS